MSVTISNSFLAYTINSQMSTIDPTIACYGNLPRSIVSDVWIELILNHYANAFQSSNVVDVLRTADAIKFEARACVAGKVPK